MAKKSSSTKKTTAAKTAVDEVPLTEETLQETEVLATEPEPATTPVVKEKKKRKTSKKTVETETVAEEAVKQEEVVVEEVSAPATTIKKTRRVIKKEEIAQELEALMLELASSSLEKDLKKRAGKTYANVVKILKLESNGPKKPRDVSNSGFMKPVGVSEPMRAFLGLGEKELTRRLDITKTLCEYIKTHDLQNPEDRRIIVPDDTLRTLLGLGKEESLTYYSIQQKLKDHIIKV